MKKASLYGITNSNRSGRDLWGKNQFNSTFPAALCCYMRDKNINPVYVSTNSTFGAFASDVVLTFNDVFNTTVANESIRFLFESNFSPYTDLLHDTLDHTDLVTQIDGQDKRALEIKLTVLPDNSTAKKKDESKWGSELVIRPVSISYACLGIYKTLATKTLEIRRLIEPVSIQVENWGNVQEILNNADALLDVLTAFFSRYYQHQIPFLIQPIWKTKGKSPLLDDNAFDVFVWSDFALLKLAVDQARAERNRTVVSRYLRSVARTVRALSDLFVSQKLHVARIFRQMALGNQTDKEFALNGGQTHQYMTHPRLTTPILEKEVLREIILNGGQNELSPERRFDATIFYGKQYF